MSTALEWLGPWLGPAWYERQGALDSPSFVPGTWLGPEVPGTLARTPPPTPTPNCTHRRATTVGSLDHAPRALVDDRGLVVPYGRGWSLDWWVRAEDRWHHPSRTRGVRQRLVDRAPVVETALRVPGGYLVQRVTGLLDGAGRPAVLVEIENGSAVPVAVALAVRPYDLTGHAPVHHLRVDAAGIEVDGRPGVVFGRPPADVVTGTAGTGDPARLVGLVPGTDPAGRAVVVEDAAGWASAVAVFPLAHTATLRALVTLDDAEVVVPSRRRRRRGGDRSAAVRPDGGATLTATSTDPGALPGAEQVAKGWEVQLRRGLQVELPDQKLADALQAARAQLLLLAAGDRLAVDHVAGAGSLAGRGRGNAPVLEITGAAEVATAMVEAGFVDEATEVLRSWPRRQDVDGAFDAERGRVGSTGAALAAVADHWRLTRDPALVDELVVALAKGAHWLATSRTSRRAPRTVGGDGLLPDDPGGPDIGGPGLYPRDSAVAARAVRALAPALTAAGQPEVAEDLTALAGRLDEALGRWLADGDGPIPAALGRTVDTGIVASLDLVGPTGAVPEDHPRVQATADRLRGFGLENRLVPRGLDRSGADPAATLRLAQVAIAVGDWRAVDDLDAVVDVAGPTVAWPTVVHPRTGGGSAGRLHDPVVTARFVRTVRRMLVRELPGDAGLALCSLVPTRWWGQSLDVRDAPTAFGSCSFSLRWHGERPALLWELEPHDGVDAVVITAPGLDPDWSSSQLRGEALLAAPVAPDDRRPALAADADDEPAAPGHEVGVDLRPRSPRPDVDGGDSFL